MGKTNWWIAVHHLYIMKVKVGVSICSTTGTKGLHSLSVNIVVAGTSLCTNAGSSFLLSHCNYSGSMDISMHMHIFSYCTFFFFVSGLTKISTSFKLSCQ